MSVFHMRVAEADREGYYHTRWDKATPVAVKADTREAAFTEVFRVMGECRRGRYWTAKVDHIEPDPCKCEARPS